MSYGSGHGNATAQFKGGHIKMKYLFNKTLYKYILNTAGSKMITEKWLIKSVRLNLNIFDEV